MKEKWALRLRLWALKMWWKQLRERVTVWVAWKVPRQLAYWVALRVAVHDYDGNPGERTALNALKGWRLG